MSNNLHICPVCGAKQQDPSNLTCSVCGCHDAFCTLFGGQNAFELWKSNVRYCQGKWNERRFVDSQSNGSSLQVTGGYLCFHNAKTNEAVICGFDAGVPQVLSNVKEIAVAGLYWVCLHQDGTLTSSGDDYYRQRKGLSSTENAISVAVAPSCSYVVTADGTVTERGVNDFKGIPSTWRNIQRVVANQFHIVGLKNDGTVVYALAHNSPVRPNAAMMSKWTNVKRVAVSDQYVLALHKDGTVSYAGEQNERAQVTQWSNIEAIAADEQYAIGLTGAGDVLLAGEESQFLDFGRKDAKQWKNMAFIAAGKSVIAGLTRSGKAKIVGSLYKSDDFERVFAETISSM